MLQNGYFLLLIGGGASSSVQMELKYAYEIDPKMVLPVLIDNSSKEFMLEMLRGKYILDVSNITSDEEKVKAITDAIIDFDLRNNK